ncbi:DUF4387 family protein [Alphaproteobacteria bacterium]|jgi:hypothetical protein|nr:DUF4387 family protein [Alphaproteobacteria bacterium]
MTSIGDTAFKVRSKNAGPFWVTVDIFCGDEAAFTTIAGQLSSEVVSQLFQQPVETIKRFEIPDLYVVKFSLPRPVVQGDRFDRDMHGAQWAVLLAEHDLEAPEAR